MIKEIKVGGGLVLDLCPYDRDFTGFECPNAFNPTRLKKILLLDCRGKISLFVRVKYSIIKF
ncbi:hypothetical protein FIM66_04525 [Helicobacter pylori]|uniref:hypothetical protein n=1 Tax=Helicobacter pylori TaxID=210 RepID=UPI000EAC49A5|nr:hypothetical protein [Helicobacter pylori]TPH29423.1 hypothetical protein FIM86_04310 [Helicobacter pylori]TPH40801.1 hypothetical protein FIM81_04310 [Helicobacter pylori]TPH61425.1 hypothetical protein FIM66_04525 [Helicobacter pylori]